MSFLQRLLLFLAGFLIGRLISRESSNRSGSLTSLPEQGHSPQQFPDVSITWPDATFILASPVGEKTPTGQLNLALEFFAKARASMGSEQIWFRPTYWEVCHAIELGLKAFLLSKGMSEGELKGFALRHNLSELLDKALQNDLYLPNDVIGVIRGLSPAHASFYFRYGHGEPPDHSLTDTIKVPSVWDAVTAARSLLMVCSAHIGQ